MDCFTYDQRVCLRSIITFCFLFLSVFTKSQIITTIAGNGTAGFAGDGGLAKNALVNTPVALCLDAAGNVFIAEYSNQRIRRIDAVTGIISTVAGNGTAGFSGDGGLAINAELNTPTWVCTDNANNLYITDFNNLRIRKVNLSTGIITTIAGDGTQNYVNGGPAVNSGMLPASLAFDAAGNLYFSQHMGPLASYTTNIVSKIDMGTGIVTTIAGTGVFGFAGDGGPALNAEFNNPNGLSFDAAGNLYVADQSNNRIRKIDKTTGIITTVAGNGGTNYNLPDGTPAVNYSFVNVADVFVDASGNLITADMSREKVQKINMTTGLISTLAGNGYVGFGQDCVPPTTVPLGDCRTAITDNAGNVYFTDQSYHRIRKVTNASITTAQIAITATANIICTGSPDTLSAMTNNIGPNPVYQWAVNGVNAGSDTTIFISSALQNNDIVLCKVIASPNSVCQVDTSAESNIVKITVNPLLRPALNIFTSSDSVCTGTTVTFNSSAINGGNNPVFKWSVDGVSAGVNKNNFTSSTLANNDTVVCLLIADQNQQCLLADSAYSDTIVMHVTANVAPGVGINSSGNTICPGNSVTFVATAQNAGSDPSYQWVVNGISVEANAATYTDTNFHNSDTVTCVLTANNPVCPANTNAVSNAEIISVKSIPDVSIGFADTTILPGEQIQLIVSAGSDVQSFLWTPANDLVNATLLSPTTIPLTQTTTYQLSAVDTDGCAVNKNIIVYVFYKLAMPNAFTPNGDGKNDVFRIPPNVTLTLKEFSVFNRWGNKIFSTTDISGGWDGTYDGIPADAGTYVYMIRGSNINGEVFAKGTVMLIR